MKRGAIQVDFNEMLEPDLVLLSKTDECIDSTGAMVLLSEGALIHVYEEDVNSSGHSDNLVASGVAERNRSGMAWASKAKWCCRIDQQGIRHQSEI